MLNKALLSFFITVSLSLASPVHATLITFESPGSDTGLNGYSEAGWEISAPDSTAWVLPVWVFRAGKPSSVDRPVN